MSRSFDWYCALGQRRPCCGRELTAGSSAALMGSERMAFWSGSVAAAEAKKAEDASMHALLTLRPPICTGKLACESLLV